MQTPTLDALASEQLNTQFTQLEDRLTHDYTSVDTSSLHDLVEHERSRFADVRIHVYLPILVERAVRAKLATRPGKHRRD